MKKSHFENLKQKHYELRDKSAVLSEAQKDYLRAIGVSEAKLNVITNGEVADLIKTCDIKFPEYIRKYIDRSVLLSEIEESNRVIKKIMSTEGLTVDLQYPVNEIVHPASSNCHIFRGERAKLLLGGEDNVHFHNNAFPLSTYDDNGNLIYLPLNPDPGTTEYDIKCDILEDHLNDVSLYVKKLYKSYTKPQLQVV